MYFLNDENISYEFYFTIFCIKKEFLMLMEMIFFNFFDSTNTKEIWNLAGINGKCFKQD